MDNKVIAVVAGREITEEEFAQFEARIPQEQQAYIKTPEGRKQALTPDITVEMSDEEWAAAQDDETKDTQLQEAYRVLSGKN